MNPLEATRQSIQPQVDALNDLIRSTLMSGNALMNKVVEGYLSTKGKQIRPIMVILAASLIGKPSVKVTQAAAAVEMLHNASLIHDDVVDETRIRRGKATVNAVWDNHIAVLVGDFFVSNALQQAIATGDIRIVDALASLGKMLSLGEIDQIYNARYHNLSEEAYFEVISRKTASLFVACVEMGAFAVGCREEDERVAALRRFAEQLGRCFQIKDDIFDYFNDPEAIGKPTGNDLREGKVTLPLLHALTAESHPRKAEMAAIVAKEELSEQEIATLTAFAHEAGGIDYAYDVMKRMRDEAVADFCTVFDPADPSAAAFISIFDYIINRNH